MKKLVKKALSLTLVLCLLIVLGTTGIATFSAEDQIPWSEKISEVLWATMDAAAGNENISVCLWYVDIDQKSVDAEVKKQTGLTVDTLNIGIPMPDTTVLDLLMQEAEAQNTKVQSSQLHKDMRSYMERTSQQRTAGKASADQYVLTHRAISREKYIAKSDKTLATIGLSSEKVTFGSQYAPMIIVEMTKEDIVTAAKQAQVVSINLHVDSNISNESSTEANTTDNPDWEQYKKRYFIR